jgi:hydroxyacylglutathione hydrolase
MLNVVAFTFNAFEENTYIISNEKNHCWIVDPGMFSDEERQILFQHIDKQQLIPQAIINTHTHIDHIFGVRALINKYGIPFGIHRAEQPILERAAAYSAMFGFQMDDAPGASFFIEENTTMMLGAEAITILFTPGHSPGSICFYYPKGGWAIAGDVLFSGSIGRTDLPGGDHDTLIKSISTQLLTLPGATRILPGHGPATTIEQEAKHNPFLTKVA